MNTGFKSFTDIDLCKQHFPKLTWSGKDYSNKHSNWICKEYTGESTGLIDVCIRQTKKGYAGEIKVNSDIAIVSTDYHHEIASTLEQLIEAWKIIIQEFAND